MPEESEFTIKMMYKSELANAYGVGKDVMIRMIRDTIKALEKQHGKGFFGDYSGRRMLTTKQVSYIVEHNGEP